MDQKELRCSACKGPYHPATGHVFTETCVLCGPCAKDFVRWLKVREGQMRCVTKKSHSKVSFMEAALNSGSQKKE